MSNTTKQKGKKSNSTQEHTPPPRSPSRRHKRATEKAAHTEEERAVKIQDAERKRKKREEKKRRKALRAQEDQLVQRPNDCEEIRALKERAQAAEAQAKTAHEELAKMMFTQAQSTPNHPTNEELIPRPGNLNHVKVKDLRRLLQLEGRENNCQWNRIRTTIRTCIHAAHMEWGSNWKGQKSRRLSRIYDAVDEAVPAMRRFKNQWATELLARDYFSGHKTYENCVDNPTTYRGRARSAKTSSTPSQSPHRSQAPRTPTPAPVASTSAVTLDRDDVDDGGLLDGQLPDLSSDDDSNDEGNAESGEQCGNGNGIVKGKGKAKERSARKL
ncbi:hypothetical protein AAF712_009219 [Marasmius tenuissimus]|uniref:Uncharacterized protein n=1 Tax=Marasmius tenuissimus TaxID=585030 RepID=A0ABR2ZQK9_9AGAR